jgi:hypothetical protein
MKSYPPLKRSPKFAPSVVVGLCQYTKPNWTSWHWAYTYIHTYTPYVKLINSHKSWEFFMCKYLLVWYSHNYNQKMGVWQLSCPC